MRARFSLIAQGNSVTDGVHPMGDLAPRDVVAAAIDARLAATGDPCVYLDARGIAGFERRFPTVTAACRAAGIDPTRQPIPVVPGAHYSCGGVVTDVYGRTDLPGLFAAGEVARTGMHGANRLASNSLLEGLVVGGRAGQAAAAHAVDAGPIERVARAGRAPRAAASRAAAGDDARTRRWFATAPAWSGWRRNSTPRRRVRSTSRERLRRRRTDRRPRPRSRPRPLARTETRAATTAATSRTPTRRWRAAHACDAPSAACR